MISHLLIIIYFLYSYLLFNICDRLKKWFFTHNWPKSPIICIMWQKNLNQHYCLFLIFWVTFCVMVACCHLKRQDHYFETKYILDWLQLWKISQQKNKAKLYMSSICTQTANIHFNIGNAFSTSISSVLRSYLKKNPFNIFSIIATI